MGFDDVPTAATLDPPLTTIGREPNAMTPARLLLDLIAGEGVESATVPTRLVKRQSA